ncbi:hypothetical protein BMETH_2254_0 [methanotrophic bacterial endosymbiont of Bathymodiolus sp.]|nr:hypothetical protein BMETH_2254_0 [methanotrophic bacterial endosymbiont of Bathymodiolus sp.]
MTLLNSLTISAHRYNEKSFSSIVLYMVTLKCFPSNSYLNSPTSWHLACIPDTFKKT